MSAFKYQWNQTIDVGTAGLLSKQWTSIRHILSLLVTANACVHVTAYVAVRRSLSTTYTAVVLGLLLRQYVSYQFGVWAAVGQWQSVLGDVPRTSLTSAAFVIIREVCSSDGELVPHVLLHSTDRRTYLKGVSSYFALGRSYTWLTYDYM